MQNQDTNLVPLEKALITMLSKADVNEFHVLTKLCTHAKLSNTGLKKASELVEARINSYRHPKFSLDARDTHLDILRTYRSELRLRLNGHAKE